jgi:hypothetical protein
MSLAFGVDVASMDVRTRATALVGALMSAALLLAAFEQWRDDELGARAWLALVCAAGCATWCALLCGRQAARRPLRLRIAVDGTAALALREGGDEVAAAVIGSWLLGSLACLRLRPATAELGSGDCLLLLARGPVGHTRWHALRRWLVWQRRSSRRRDPSRHGETAAA